MSNGIELQKTITIVNNTKMIETFKYYTANFVVELEPMDSITIDISTPEELAYYSKIKENLAN